MKECDPFLTAAWVLERKNREPLPLSPEKLSWEKKGEEKPLENYCTSSIQAYIYFHVNWVFVSNSNFSLRSVVCVRAQCSALRFSRNWFSSAWKILQQKQSKIALSISKPFWTLAFDWAQEKWGRRESKRSRCIRLSIRRTHFLCCCCCCCCCFLVKSL